MLNLLIKDLMLLRKNAWVPLVYSFMVFFLFSKTGSSQMVYVMGITMISYLMVMYSTAYDDMNKSDLMLNSLPLRRRDIVFERYLSLFVFIMGTSLVMAASGSLIVFTGFIENVRFITLSDVALATFSICFVVFLYLPIYFKLGYLKAKLANFAIFFAVFLIPTAIGRLATKGNPPSWVSNLNSVSETRVVLILGLAALVLGVLSFSLSLRFYQKREF